MYAILLAGSQAPSDKLPYVDNKALLDINGNMMVSYVIKALTCSQYITHIIVVGPPQLKHVIAPSIKWVSQGADIVDNLLRGCKEVPNGETRVLVSTTDIPWLTARAVDDFIEQAKQRTASIYYPVVNKNVIAEAFPAVTRTYVRLREGHFTGGNIFVMKPEVVNQLELVMRQIEERRKRPWRLFQLLGWTFSINLIRGKLSITDVEARVAQRFHIKAEAIISQYPEIGTDVDKESDLSLARAMLQ